MGPLLVVASMVLLTGCSAMSVFGGPTDSESVDFEDYPEPITFVDGAATLRLTGGTEMELELPIQVGSSRMVGEGDWLGFRADPWAFTLSSSVWDTSDQVWWMTLHRLDHGHWTASPEGGCTADVSTLGVQVTGTVTCGRLEWMDTLALDAGRIPGEQPFDAQASFTVTAAGPEPSPRPAPTLAPGATLDPAVRTITASHILYSPLDDPAKALELPLTHAAWVTAGREAQAAADDLRAILDTDEVIAAFEERAREGDDGTAATGGSLGSFTRDAMVAEFADPLFDAVGLQRGDIVGPVRTDFGWHVILYLGEGEPASF